MLQEKAQEVDELRKQQEDMREELRKQQAQEIEKLLSEKALEIESLKKQQQVVKTTQAQVKTQIKSASKKWGVDP